MGANQAKETPGLLDFQCRGDSGQFSNVIELRFQSSGLSFWDPIQMP
jgi:hypothetical protein